MKKGRILYIMDPLCGWCYGFSAVMQEFQKKYQSEFDFQVVVGGMMTGLRVEPVAAMASYILSAYKRVEEYTGVTFGEPYLELLSEGTDISNSEPPCRAIYTFGHMVPGRMLDFAHSLQQKHFVEGKSFNDENTYREMALEFDLNPEEFLAAMKTEDNRYGTQQEFQWAKSANITGFPSTVLQYDGKYYMLSQGFRPLEDIEKILQYVIEEAETISGQPA